MLVQNVDLRIQKTIEFNVDIVREIQKQKLEVEIEKEMGSFVEEEDSLK